MASFTDWLATTLYISPDAVATSKQVKQAQLAQVERQDQGGKISGYDAYALNRDINSATLDKTAASVLGKPGAGGLLTDILSGGADSGINGELSYSDYWIPGRDNSGAETAVNYTFNPDGSTSYTGQKSSSSLTYVLYAGIALVVVAFFYFGGWKYVKGLLKR